MSNPNPSINRHLKDKAFDYMDHALGRPIDPLQPSYRNYFAIGGKSDLAEQFRSSPYWVEGRRRGDMTSFYVNIAGREALDNHLDEIGDKNRLFEVLTRMSRYDAWESEKIVATSHSGAKYALYQHWETELSFKKFLALVGPVRVLTKKRTSRPTEPRR